MRKENENEKRERETSKKTIQTWIEKRRISTERFRTYFTKKYIDFI